MSSETKTDVETSNIDLDAHNLLIQGRARLYRAADALRLLLTGLSFACAAFVLGLSASALAAYERTHLSDAAFNLPLWPEGDFDLRPTRAMIATGAIVVASSGVSILSSKVETIRKRASAHTSITFAAPIIGLIAALVAVGLHYGVDSSSTSSTIISWSCRWRSSVMLLDPHFGTLCRQGEASIALAVLLIPVEVITLVIAGYEASLERQLDLAWRQRGLKGSGSPTLT
jgi:hypothetical protein